MAAVKLRAKVKILGINPYLLVSRKQADQIRPGWRKPLPVLVRVNGQPSEHWHINMMPVGNGDFYLYLHGDVRKSSGTKVGDIISVKLEFDSEYRSGPPAMPEWFTQALTNQPVAMANWKKLAPSRQKEVLRYLISLKSGEARARNTEQTIKALSGKRVRLMGRTWSQGS